MQTVTRQEVLKLRKNIFAPVREKRHMKQISPTEQTTNSDLIICEITWSTMSEKCVSENTTLQS